MDRTRTEHRGALGWLVSEKFPSESTGYVEVNRWRADRSVDLVEGIDRCREIWAMGTSRPRGRGAVMGVPWSGPPGGTMGARRGQRVAGVDAGPPGAVALGVCLLTTHWRHSNASLEGRCAAKFLTSFKRNSRSPLTGRFGRIKSCPCHTTDKRLKAVRLLPANVNPWHSLTAQAIQEVGEFVKRAGPTQTLHSV